jgi:hypothetical protein
MVVLPAPVVVVATVATAAMDSLWATNRMVRQAQTVVWVAQVEPVAHRRPETVALVAQVVAVATAVTVALLPVAAMVALRAMPAMAAQVELAAHRPRERPEMAAQAATPERLVTHSLGVRWKSALVAWAETAAQAEPVVLAEPAAQVEPAE